MLLRCTAFTLCPARRRLALLLGNYKKKYPERSNNLSFSICYQSMSGWIKEKEEEEATSGAAKGQGEERVVSGGDTLRVTSSEPLRCSLKSKDGEEETRQLKEEVVRLEDDLVELRSKYKKVRAEKRELRRRLASVSNEKQVIEVVTSGGGDGGGQGDSKESAVGDFEKLRLANDQKVLEVEALVDGLGLEAKRLREEKEELQEELRDTKQR